MGGRCCHVVLAVPGSQPLLRQLVGRGLWQQAALLLVVHKGLLVGSGHRADHFLLAAV